VFFNVRNGMNKKFNYKQNRTDDEDDGWIISRKD